MKRFVPLKYILLMITMFLVIPLTLLLLIVFVIGFINKFTIAVAMFFGAIIISGPFVYVYNQENASILIENNQIINYINDGTNNFGWAEEINRLEKIELVNREEARKYYKNCRAKKCLLLSFGSYNIKYIAVGQFTKRQTNQIIEYFRNSK